MKITSRILIVLAMCAAALAFTSTSAFAAGQLVFSDEMNGPMDTSVWANKTPWGSDCTIGELEHYQPSDTTYANGNMTLTSEKRWTSGYSWYMPNGFDYTSGIVTSLNRAKFSYGYFEIRAKLPTGKGMWPAFWLTNDSTLEIDGFEMLGDKPGRIYQTLHENKQQVYSTYHDGPDYSAGYHTYGIDWQPTYVKWYIDGVNTMTYNAPMPSDPLYICLNTAVGGSWPGSPDATTVFPQHYDIDYVRVYDTKPVAPAPAVVANADAYSTNSGVSLNVPAAGVLANDTDAAGRTMTAAVVSQPTHGTLSLGADGSFNYVPAAGYSGSDSFTYTASDGVNTSSAGTVSLKIVAPTTTTTTVTTPVVKKKGRTRTASVSGSLRLGSYAGVSLASYATKTPVVLKVRVQRLVHGRWVGYRTKVISNPATSVKTTVRLRKGTFRVRLQVSGGGHPAGNSKYCKRLRVR